MAPGQRLSSYPSETAKQFNTEFTNRMTESALKYGGKLVNRAGKGFACYFPDTSDRSNVEAFRNALLCSIEQLDKMGPLSYDMMRLRIPKTSYKICIDYETLSFETSEEEAINSPIGLPHLSKISWVAPGNVMGENLYMIISSSPELSRQFGTRKIGECIIYPNTPPYSIYLYL